MKIKNLNLKPLLLGMIMSVGLASCNNGGNGAEGDAVAVDGVAEPAPTPVEPIENDTLGAEAPEFIQEYIDIKDALVNDNYEQARQAAANFQSALEETDTKLSEAEKTALQENARKIAQANDIDAIRENFSALSRQLYQVEKANDLTDQTLYFQHCPMAMGGQGANWLSMQEEVQNPYMGQRMPNCGSVQETLN